MRLKRVLNEMAEEVANWKNYLRSNSMLSSAVKILNKITSRGYTAYIVGGAVRDIVLGLDPHDIDICGNAPLDVIREMFDTYDLSGEEFGIIGIKINGHTYEYALFRGESYQKIKGVRKILL